MLGNAARMGEMRDAYKILVGKTEGKAPVRRRRRRWKYNIRMVLMGDVDWFHLAQDSDQWQALVNTVIKLRVP